MNSHVRWPCIHEHNSFHRIKAYWSKFVTSWTFQHLRYSVFSKFSTLSRNIIRGPTRSENARHPFSVGLPMEWCVHLYVRGAELLFPKLTSQKTIFSFSVSAVTRILGCALAIPIPRFSCLRLERLGPWRRQTKARVITDCYTHQFKNKVPIIHTDILLNHYPTRKS